MPADSEQIVAFNACLLIEHGCEEGLAGRTAKMLDDKNREIVALQDLAKSLSNALLKVRPLGGSEMFVKRCGDYYADPGYCGAMIDRFRNENTELRKQLARSKKD